MGLNIRVSPSGRPRSLKSTGVTSGLQPVERDSRGILDPWLLRQRVRLTRYPAGPMLVGLVDRFWAVRWDLPPGVVHRQQVLTHPGANLSVGHPSADASAGPTERIEARLNGVARDLTTRILSGRGWAVAAMTTPGGLGAFISTSAADFTDRIVALGQAIGADETSLLRHVVAQPDETSRVAALAAFLEQAVKPQRTASARQVAEVAKVAETDRGVRRLSQLCATAGTGQRSLQRLFLQHAGVSPTWVLRRYRLLEAAEAVRSGEPVSWAQVAADLGYADQAHLTRAFRAAIGQTPAAYAQAQAAR
jgi:AraC-like DNA-binding protein